MTTIAYRDGKMAADTRAYSGNPTPIGFKSKIHRLEDGSLVGCSTTEPGLAEAFAAWLNDNAGNAGIEQLGDKLKIQALHVKPDGSVFYYADSVLPVGPLYGAFFAIGSGDQYAIGALSCGATAEAAVMVAAQHDNWTGGEIITVALHPEMEAANNDAPEIQDAEIVEERPAKKRRTRAA